MRTRSKRKVTTKTPDVPRVLMLLGIEFQPRNGEYWANCPHPKHAEKTASWSINDDGSHHCFGCKWEGGILELVLRNIGLSGYGAAKTWMDERACWTEGAVPLAVKLKVVRPDHRNTLQFPEDIYIGPLGEWVTPARRYAIKRGITREQVVRWGLGYAVGGYYNNRIILPTRSKTGQLLNISGRTWSKTGSPKYLNAKELHGWDPSAIFGERYWPEYMTRATLVLCEGELNALAVERRNLKVKGEGLFIGALGGSQLEKEQVMKVSRFQRVIIASDMDRAGSDLARALRASLARWRRCSVVNFPDKRDPNDLERQDPGMLDDLIMKAVG